MANYTFTNFGKNRGTSNNTTFGRQNTPSTGVKAKTERQIQYYRDLCAQRKVTPKNYILMSYDELAQEIATVKDFYPASDAQIKIIKDKLQSLSEFGQEINAPDFSTLTGGKNGTASSLIEALLKLERQHTDKIGVTEPQIEMLVGMYLCPDVPFEAIGVNRKVLLNPVISYSSDMPYDEQFAHQTWRKMTPDEFANEIKNKVTKRDASAFIDAHRGIFHTWKTTRIRPEQERYIRQLEDRMADLSSPTVVEWSVDINGNMVQIIKQDETRKEYNPRGCEPLDDLSLKMFSVEDASTYIDILKSELNRKELYSYGEVSDNSMTFEAIRTPSTSEKKRDKEMQQLEDLMFRLEAVAGYENDEIHQTITPYLFEDDVDCEIVQENKDKVRDFMKFLIAEQYITFDGMIQICSDCEIAQHILLGL